MVVVDLDSSTLLSFLSDVDGGKGDDVLLSADGGGGIIFKSVPVFEGAKKIKTRMEKPPKSNSKK